jgi:hypothetical protein
MVNVMQQRRIMHPFLDRNTADCPAIRQHETVDFTLKRASSSAPRGEERFGQSNGLNVLNALELGPRSARNRGNQLQFAPHVVP